MTVLAACLQTPSVKAQNQNEVLDAELKVEHKNSEFIPLEQRVKASYDAYILGPGDGLQIELLDLPELSGTRSIGPDGTIYLPRLRALNVEGLTIEELRYLLTEKYRKYVKNPNVYIRHKSYRPDRIYVGGEVKSPGYYTLDSFSKSDESAQLQTKLTTDEFQPSLEQIPSRTFGTVFPTVFDAIRTAQGITPYSDLGQVQVIRRRAIGLGGGYMKTDLNFLSLITEGDESNNIRLFDGDVLKIRKSPVVLREQLLKAGQSNLSPQFIEIFVTGRVKNPGSVKLPQGSTLNQAISVAGGPKFLKGRIEFVRFNTEGTVDRRLFSYRPSAAADAINNPVLAAGDLISIRDSLLSGTVGALNEFTGPFVGLYSVYRLFE